MKTKVKIPLFFYVDSLELNGEQKSELVDWFNKAMKTKLSGPDTYPIVFNDEETRYYGYIDLGTERNNSIGVYSSCYEDEFVSTKTPRVEYDFWKEHIKDYKYQVIGVDIEDTGNIPRNVFYNREVERHEVIPGFLSCSEIKKQAELQGVNYPKYQKRILLHYRSATLFSSFGYTLHICDYPLMSIGGTAIPKGMLKSALVRKQVFKCALTGNYDKIRRALEVIGIEGQTMICSSRYSSFLHSERYDLWFHGEESARNYGFDYCEINNDWVKADEAIKEPNANYHRMAKLHGHQWKCDRETVDFTIGFEIEKEDEDMKYKYPYKKLFDDTRWIKESDSSLCPKGGYELVSPVFNLMDNSLEKELEQHECIRELIDGTINTRIVTQEDIDDDMWSGYPDLEEGDNVPSCGGHINLGSRVYSPIQLFFGLKQFLPLLYSIYNLRVDRTYSEAKKVSGYLDSMGHNDHHSALQIKDSVIEFRIVAAVRNVNNLLWRRDLIKIMVNNINKSEQDVLRMMLNPRSILYKHLRKVYKSDERYMKKCNDFVKFSDRYNDVKLSEIDWSRFKI